jgi:hypothetical protein
MHGYSKGVCAGKDGGESGWQGTTPRDKGEGRAARRKTHHARCSILAECVLQLHCYGSAATFSHLRRQPRLRLVVVPHIGALTPCTAAVRVGAARREARPGGVRNNMGAWLFRAGVAQRAGTASPCRQSLQDSAVRPQLSRNSPPDPSLPRVAARCSGQRGRRHQGACVERRRRWLCAEERPTFSYAAIVRDSRARARSN